MFRSGANCQRQCVECKLFSEIRRFQSSKISAVVANSARVLETHQKAGFFQRIKSHVIFNIGRNASGQLSSKLESPNLTFGYIGRIEPMKGVEIVLEAISRLKHNNWRLVIAGHGNDEYVAHLKQKFSRGEIVWLGFVEPLAFYSEIDVCLVPSIWEEPLPRALLESFSYGKSAICSSVGGNLEAAALGRQVESYPAEDIDALAEILARATENPSLWKAGGFASPEAEAQISETSIVTKYANAYALAMDGAAPAT